jgi:hypothetical protein
LQNITDIEYAILKTLSLTLFKSGVYFSKDLTKEAQQAGYLGKDLDGVKYDVYKRFSSVMQNLLLQKELSKTNELSSQPAATPVSKSKKTDIGKIVRTTISAMLILITILSATACNFTNNNKITSTPTSISIQSRSESVVHRDNRELFESFKDKNFYFMPGAAYESMPDEERWDLFQKSVDFTNSPESKAIIDAERERTGISNEVLIVFGSMDGIKFPAALHNGIIIIPYEQFKPDALSIEYGLNINVGSLMAHEEEHRKNSQDVQSGNMTWLEDEAHSFLAGAFNAPVDEDDYVMIDGRKVNGVEGRKAIAFQILLDNREEAIDNNFIKLDSGVNLYTINYTGVIRRPAPQGKEYEKVKEYFNPDLEKDELEITLRGYSSSGYTDIKYAVNHATGQIRIIETADSALSIGGQIKRLLVKLFKERGARFYDVYLAPVCEMFKVASVIAGRHTLDRFLNMHTKFIEDLALRATAAAGFESGGDDEIEWRGKTR